MQVWSLFITTIRLPAHNESAPWSGHAGVWNAWQNNGDPGGAGWWLVIPAPEKSLGMGME